MIQRKGFFQNHPIFRKLTPEESEEILQLSQERFFEGKQSIIEEGEMSGGIYFIRNGRVGVVKKRGSSGPEVIAYLSDGEFFGEMSFLDGQPTIAAIIASEATICEFLPEDELKKFLANHSSFAFHLVLNIARSLCSRLRETDERLVRFMSLIRENEQ
ncbi:MAG: cyclic nucleotide-binding domain-containing protein [Nitrospirae bacterium]|nr:cyclic nucleotide-binding domain-containing protein [Nitrospirota bacterium]